MGTKASILADVTRITKLESAPNILDSTDLEDIMQTEATEIYSKHRPYKRIADISAANTYSYEINNTVLTGWIDEVSWIDKILYPADEYQNPESEEVPFEDWEIYEDTTKKYLRFTAETPSTGIIRVFYYGMHSVPDSGNATVYTNDLGAFANLSSSLAAMAIANYYGNTASSAITADAVAYRDKSDVWGTRSKNLWTRYFTHLFPEKVGAAGAFREFDTMYKELSLGRLTHKGWTR